MNRSKRNVMNAHDLDTSGLCKTWFVPGTALLLLITAGLKLLSVVSETRVLGVSDPLLSSLTERQMLFVAALMEVGVAGALLWRGDVRRGAWLVLWLVGVFGVYRIGLKAIGFQGHCPCLGHVLAWLPGFTAWSDPVMVGALAAMGVGSLWVLATQAGSDGNCQLAISDSAGAGKRVLDRDRRMSRSTGAETAFALVLAVTGVASVQAAQVPPLATRATVTKMTFRPGEVEARSRSDASVRVYSSNRWWRIDVTPVNSAALEVDCMRIPDGVRLYAVPKVRSLGGTNLIPGAQAMPLAYPPPDNAALLASWLAFCPHPELPRVDERHLRRFLGTDLQNHPSNRATFAASFLPPEKAFLSSLSLTNDGLVFLADGRLSRAPPPFEQGVIEFSYTVTRTTNFMGLVLPAAATLKRYAISPGAQHRSDVYEWVVAHVVLNSVEALGTASLPPTESPLLALDRRPPGFDRTNELSYLVTNDLWKPISDVEIRSLRAIREGTTRRAGRTHRLFFASVLIAVTSIPLIAISVRSMRASMQRTEKSPTSETT